MTTRLLSLSLLVAASTFATACGTDGGEPDTRKPYVDDWKVELSGPAAQITKLSIGDRIASDNFANRGDIEVIYSDATDQITIEMQRFTIAKNDMLATEAFGRMQFWAYDISSPAAPKPEDAADACWATDVTGSTCATTTTASSNRSATARTFA